MASKTVSTKVLNVCKTTEQWAAESAVISKGLLCIEFTTDGKTLVTISSCKAMIEILKKGKITTFFNYKANEKFHHRHQDVENCIHQKASILG